MVRKLHRIIGLLMLIPVAIVLGSGVLLLFLDRDGASIAELAPMSSAELAGALSKVVAENHGKLAPVLVMRQGEKISVRLNKPGVMSLKGASRHSVKLGKADFSDSSHDSWFRTKVLEIHRDFGFGKQGKGYMTYVAWVFLGLLISGFLAVSVSTLQGALRHVRYSRWRRLGAYHSHYLLGLCLMPFLLYMVGTGLTLYYKNRLFTSFQKEAIGQLATEVEQGSSRIDGPRAYALARDKVPGGSLYFMAYPGNDYAGLQYFALVFNGRLASEKILVLVNKYTGQVFVPEVPPLVAFSFLAVDLHTGVFFSPIMSDFILFMGLISIGLVFTGFTLSYRRFRRRFRVGSSRSLVALARSEASHGG